MSTVTLQFQVLQSGSQDLNINLNTQKDVPLPAASDSFPDIENEKQDSKPELLRMLPILNQTAANLAAGRMLEDQQTDHVEEGPTIASFLNPSANQASASLSPLIHAGEFDDLPSDFQFHVVGEDGSPKETFVFSYPEPVQDLTFASELDYGMPHSPNPVKAPPNTPQSQISRNQIPSWDFFNRKFQDGSKD